jgi:dihydroflavonol-4-reductase
MRVAITGASGFLGGALVRASLEQGAVVRACVHRSTRAIEGLPVERAPISLADGAGLVEAFEGCELVIHAAGFISLLGQRARLEAANVEGTRRVVTACRAAGVKRLVHVSSIEALLPGRSCGRPISEREPPEPDSIPNAYGRSKALAERVVLEAAAGGLDAILVNPTALVGPFDHGPSQSGRAILDLALGRLPALMPGDFDWVDVRDVARGCLQAAERGRRGERYLLSGEVVDLAELARRVAALSGRRAPRLMLPGWLARAAAHLTPPYYWLSGGQPRFSTMSVRLVQARYRFDRSKAEAELGYRARPAEETLADTIAWFREAGRLPG